MPYRRAAEVVLAKWREVERQLAELDAEDPEAEAFQADAARLEREYQALVELIAKMDSGESTPLPEAT
jgi:hypothetical protein